MLTPLTGIIGCAELLRDGLDSMARGEMLETIDMMEQSAHRLLRLVQNHLLYAQIELLARDVERAKLFRPQLTSGTAVLIKAAAQAAAQRHGRAHNLEFDLSDAPVAMGEEHLKKVVEELVDNAAKFSPAGSSIRIAGAAEDTLFRLAVCDHGPGISPEQMSRLGAFQQFNRVRNEQQGMGLGLSIARRLVELHNGVLTLVSQPAGGLTVTVQLPAKIP